MLLFGIEDSWERFGCQLVVGSFFWFVVMDRIKVVILIILVFVLIC